MTDNQIRREIIKMLLQGTDEVSPSFIARKLGISEFSAQGNLQYLADGLYVMAFYDSEGGITALSNERSSSYLVTPDSSIANTTINVSGSSNFVAGRDMSLRDASIVNQALPADLQTELDELISEIREGSISKSEQSSKFAELLKKCFVSASSSVAVAAATSLFKAAIGIS